VDCGKQPFLNSATSMPDDVGSSSVRVSVAERGNPLRVSKGGRCRTVDAVDPLGAAHGRVKGFAYASDPTLGDVVNEVHHRRLRFHRDPDTDERAVVPIRSTRIA
jgi:hypothetical protein